MLGPLIRTAATMASYAVSSMLVRKGAAELSTRVAKQAERIAVKAIASPSAVVSDIAKAADSLFNFTKNNYVSTRVRSWASTPKGVTEQISYIQTSRARQFVHEMREGVDRALRARFQPHQVRYIHTAMRQVGTELTFLPANYIAYRYEKHKAITPEQREETKSFARWYFKGGMFAISIGSGIAMERLGRGIVRKSTMRAISALSPHIRRRAFDALTQKNQTASVFGAMRTIAERGLAILEARRRVTEGRGIMSLLATGERPSTIARKIIRESDTIYRQQFAPGTRRTQAQQLQRDIEAMIKDLEKKGAGDRHGFNPEFIKSAVSKVIYEYQGAFKRYAGSTKSWNKLMRFMDFQEGSTTWRRAYQAKYATSTVSYTIGGESIEHIVYEDPAIFSFSGRRADLGLFSVSKMRDLMVRGMQRSLPGFVIDMFSMRDMFMLKTSEEALRTSVHRTEKGSLYLPMGYGGSPDPMATAKQMLNLSPEQDVQAKAFVYGQARRFGSRLSGMTREEIDEVIQKDGARLFMASAAHGEILLNSQDVIIHAPGGKAFLMTHLRTRQGKQGKPFTGFFALGHIGNGEYMTFSRLTSQVTDTATKIQRRFLGSELVEVGTRGYKIEVGPRQTGMVIDAPGEEAYDVGLVGLARRLGKFLEYGQSEERGSLAALHSIFSKFKDPRYLPTLMSDEYMGNPQFIEQVVSNRRGMHDLVTLIKDETNDAFLETWMRLHKRYSTEKLVQTLHTKFDMNGFITGSMTADEAAGRIRDFLDTKLKQHKGIRYAFSDSFINLRKVLATLDAASGKSTYEAIGELPGGKQYRFGLTSLTPSMIDVANSEMLKLEAAIADQARFTSLITTVAVNDTERSALMASGKLARLSYGLGTEVRQAMESETPDAFEASSNGVRRILDEFFGPSTKTRDELITYYERAKPLSSVLPFPKDVRYKVDSPDFQEIMAISDGRNIPYRGLISAQAIENGSHRPVGVLDMPNIMTMTLLRAFNKASTELLGIGISEAKAPTPGIFVKKLVTKRVVPTLAGLMSYSVLDRLADRYLDGTPLGEGLTTFGLNVYAGLKVASFNMLEAAGVTDLAAYFEDLMPGFISSPLSGAVRGLGPVAAGMWAGMRSMGPRGGIMGGMIGGAIGMLLGGLPLGIFGDWDISKSRDDIVRELQGRELVPVRKGRWWELSAAPFEGGRVQYYRPHLYALLRSRYKQSPEFKQSIFSEIVGALAPDYYAVKDYYSRPYPVTAGLLGGIPIIGPALRSVPFVGKILGGGIPMHGGEASPVYAMRVSDEFGGAPTADSLANSLQSGSGIFEQTRGSGGFTFQPDYPGVTERPMTASDAVFGMGEAISQLQDIVGLRGFLIGSLYEEMTGRKSLLDFAPQLADPSDIGGFRRSYWDYEFGGLLGASEVIRRYIPHRRNEIQLFNPIRNTMPTWLPGKDYYIDFQHGDPFTVVPLGEARLPGVGYEKLHDVDLTFPLLGDVIGEEVDSQVAFLLGYPEHMAPRNRALDAARVVAEELAANASRAGDLLKKGATIYNPEYDLTAQVELILRDEAGGRVPVKVVPKGFAGESSLNAFLVLNDAPRGILVEVDPETYGTTETMITRDLKLFERDLQRGLMSRATAIATLKQMDRNKRPHNLANAYSWLDRYRILADVAPFSNETRTAEAIVQQQLISGMYTPEQVGEVERIRQRLDKVSKPIETDEYRFLNLGEHVTKTARERDEYIANEYNFLERTIGSMWERVTHYRNPLSTKLLNTRSALEDYQERYVYGKQLQMWENPVTDFLETYANRMLAVTDPIQGAMSLSIGGAAMALIPGTLGMVVPTPVLAGVGAAMGLVGSLKDTLPIPERTESARDARRQYDAHLYVRNMMLYQKTRDPSYLDEANKTMTASLVAGRIPQDSTLRSYFGTAEAELLDTISENVTASELNRVESILPREYLPAFYQKIGKAYQGATEAEQLGEEPIELAGLESPIYDPTVAPESVMMQTMELRGLNAHDVGLGWYGQVARLERERTRGVPITPSTALPDKEGVTTLQKYMSDPRSLTVSTGAKISRMLDLPAIVGSIIRPIGGVVMQVADDGFDIINIEVTLV